MQSSNPALKAGWWFGLLTVLLGGVTAPCQPTAQKTLPADPPAENRLPKPDSDLATKSPLGASDSQSKSNDSAPLVKLVSPGVFQVGTVTLDKQHRIVSFPVTLNSSSGSMEYLLVTSYGKVHESILKTEVAPYHIHIAMLLLGAKLTEESPSNRPVPTLGPIKNPSKEILPGDRVYISVNWKVGPKQVERPVEELIYNQQTHSALESESWVYNGSSVLEGRFLAQSEGSIISLITDPVALLNNIGPGHDNDRIWAAATNSLPPPNLPLEMRIKLADKLP